MLIFLVFAAFLVMLAIVWLKEGWKKALKIIGFWFGSFLICGAIAMLLGVEAESGIGNVIKLLLWGAWTVGLVIYNFKEGYIGRF